MLSKNIHPINLNELISLLREELLEEMLSDPPLFAITSVQLELTFTVERSLEGGINLQVVQAGANKTLHDVQTIKLELSPLVTIEEMRKAMSAEQKQAVQKTLTRDNPFPE